MFPKPDTSYSTPQHIRNVGPWPFPTISQFGRTIHYTNQVKLGTFADEIGLRTHDYITNVFNKNTTTKVMTQLRSNDSPCILDQCSTSTDIHKELNQVYVYCISVKALHGSALRLVQASQIAQSIRAPSAQVHCALAQNYVDALFLDTAVSYCTKAQQTTARHILSIHYPVEYNIQILLKQCKDISSSVSYTTRQNEIKTRLHVFHPITHPHKMPIHSTTTSTKTLPPTAPMLPAAPTLPPSPRSPTPPLTKDQGKLDRPSAARYARTTPSCTPRSPITSPLTQDPGTLNQHHTKRRSSAPSPSPPRSPSPLTQPYCVRLQPQTKRPCIEAHRLASESDSNIEPLLK